MNAFRNIDRLKMETDFPGLQLGKFKKIFDQQVQPLGMFVHRPQKAEIGFLIVPSINERFQVPRDNR